MRHPDLHAAVKQADTYALQFCGALEGDTPTQLVSTIACSPSAWSASTTVAKQAKGTQPVC